MAVEQPVPSQSAQIGDKVVIRLDTARQEQPPVSVEPGVRLAIQQIVPESQVSFWYAYSRVGYYRFRFGL